MQPYILNEQFADNGEHSHWELINRNGEVVWSEDEPLVVEGGSAEEIMIRLRDCYNKYIHLLAEQLYQFRHLAKDIHGWAIEKSLERKMRALDRLETEFYQLSITPESAEIITARENLADALAAMELYRTTPPSKAPVEVVEVGWYSVEDMRKAWKGGRNWERNGDAVQSFNEFINSLNK